VPAGVDGSSRDLNPDQLHHRAWPLAEPVLRRPQTAAATAFRMLEGTGRTSSDPAEILAAAHQGRVEILFLSTNAPERRTSRDAGPLIRLGDGPRPRRATRPRRGGDPASRRQRVRRTGRPPGTDPVAAILRY
jgi:hypothetical protein